MLPNFDRTFLVNRLLFQALCCIQRRPVFVGLFLPFQVRKKLDDFITNGGHLSETVRQIKKRKMHVCCENMAIKFFKIEFR